MTNVFHGVSISPQRNHVFVKFIFDFRYLMFNFRYNAESAALKVEGRGVSRPDTFASKRLISQSNLLDQLPLPRFIQFNNLGFLPTYQLY